MEAHDLRRRGWLLAADERGRPVTSAAALSRGARLALRLRDGEARAVVERVTEPQGEGMTQVTFEDGYRRLQGIAERLNSDEVPVHEMCDLFAEGTGLHQALTGYLGEQKARVEAIERGEGVQPFRIVAPGGPRGRRASGHGRNRRAAGGAARP